MRADAAAPPPPAPPLTAAPAAAALTRRASLNAVQSLLDYSAKLAVGLVVTPILVDGLGRSLYGVWEMLGRLIGYISATDGRPTEALRLVIATRQARDDAPGHRRAVGSALVVWLAFLPVVVAIGAVLVWLAPSITKVTAEVAPAVRVTAALLVAGFLVAGLAAVPESVLRGMNLGYKRMGLQAGLSIAGGVLMALAVTRGLGLAGVAGAQLALGALTGICFWALAGRYVPWFGVARPSRPEVGALLAMSGWLAGGELIAKLSLASDAVILGAIVSSSVVTTYVLTGYAARLALGLHFLTVGSAMPGLGGVIGQGDFPRAAELRRELLALTWLFATSVGATILLWNRSFLSLWVGGQLYAGFWVNFLTVLVTVQTALVRSDAYVLDAALRPRPRVVVSVIAAALIIGVSLALTPALGMVGVCLGLLVGRAPQSLAYPALASASLGGPRRVPLRPIVRPALVAAVLLVAAGAVGERVRAPNWPAWAGLVALSFALLLGAALVAGLPRELRRRVLARGREAWRGAWRTGGRDG
jgi:O-antigen/teichoic acid export membrane protein